MHKKFAVGCICIFAVLHICAIFIPEYQLKLIKNNLKQQLQLLLLLTTNIFLKAIVKYDQILKCVKENKFLKTRDLKRFLFK